MPLEALSLQALNEHLTTVAESTVARCGMIYPPVENTAFLFPDDRRA
jgi:hypothetical protein